LADHFGAGFVPVRKRGKLPAPTLVESYDLEYGSAQIKLHSDVHALLTY
jgi:adenine phosphoribosyltransferase